MCVYVCAWGCKKMASISSGFFELDDYQILPTLQHSEIMHPTEILGNIFCVMPSTSQLISRVKSESDASANKQMQFICKETIVFN